MVVNWLLGFRYLVFHNSGDGGSSGGYEVDWYGYEVDWYGWVWGRLIWVWGWLDVFFGLWNFIILKR